MIILGIILHFGIPECFAQDQYSFTVGREKAIPSGSIIWPSLMEGNNCYWTLRLSHKECFDCKNETTGAYLDKFDKELDHIGSIPIVIEPSPLYKKPVPRQIYFLNNQFFIFAEELNVSNLSATAILFIIDTTGHAVGEPMILGEAININKPSETTSEYLLEGIFRFGLYNDNNRSRFLFVQFLSQEEYTDTRINIRVLDSTAKLQWENHLVLPYDPFYTEISKMILFGEDLLFILSIFDPFGNDAYKIVTFNRALDEIKYYDFGLDNNKIRNVEVNQVDEANIYIYGLYSEVLSKNDVDGLFFWLFNEVNKKILTFATSEVNVDEIKSIRNEDLKNLHAREVYLLENGDVVFIAEIEYNEVLSFQDSESKLYFITYRHSNEIIVSKFNTEGKLDWQTMVPKLQFRHDDLVSGYHSTMYKNNLYLLYNDHPKNINIYDPDDMKQMKSKFELIVGEINLETGMLTKSQINPDNKDKKIIFRKNYTFNTRNNQILILDQTGSSVKLAKFNFLHEK